MADWRNMLIGAANDWRGKEGAWQNWFNITTLKPSAVVLEGAPRILGHGPIADCGCGNGRNALYFAGNGYDVDAVDAEDTKFLENAPAEIRKRIAFSQQDVMEFRFQKQYAGVVAARLIQYLNPADMRTFLDRAAESLRPGGVLMLSYTAKGGVHLLGRIETYEHPKEEVLEQLVAKELTVVCATPGTGRSTNVTYEALAQTYDIIARRRLFPGKPWKPGRSQNA